jgi:hypothetical protein
MTIMGNFSAGSAGPNKSPMAFNMPISLRGHANPSQHVNPSPPSPTSAKVSFARQPSIVMNCASQILMFRISGTELTWQGAPYTICAESRRIGKGPSHNSILSSPRSLYAIKHGNQRLRRGSPACAVTQAPASPDLHALPKCPQTLPTGHIIVSCGL